MGQSIEYILTLTKSGYSGCLHTCSFTFFLAVLEDHLSFLIFQNSGVIVESLGLTSWCDSLILEIEHFCLGINSVTTLSKSMFHLICVTKSLFEYAVFRLSLINEIVLKLTLGAEDVLKLPSTFVHGVDL